MSVSFEGVSLHVADVERSVEFYSRLPGAEVVVHRPGQFARFKIGDGFLHVVKAPAEMRFHMEFGTEQNLNDLHAQLSAAGIEPDSLPTKRGWGRTDLRVYDPDGNLLEFDAPEDKDQA